MMMINCYQSIFMKINQQPIHWPNPSIPPLNLWNIWPSQAMLDLHFKHNQEMFEEHKRISDEIRDNKQT